MNDPSLILVLKLVGVFAALLISLRAGLKLTRAMLVTIAATILLYGFSP